MLELFVIICVSFLVGFVIGWNQREAYAKKRVDFLMDHLNDALDQELKDTTINISIEKQNGVFYVYGKETNDFMGQGTTRKELETVLAERYPDKRFAATKQNLAEVGFE